MTPPIATTCTNECCPVHPEFSKRIDDRWDSHLESHVREKSELCRKIDALFDAQNRMNAKINYMLGGAMGIGFLLGLLADKIK